MRIDRGTIALAAPNPTVGHEQKGMRPCVIVPITGTAGKGALYPTLAFGRPPFPFVDQLRSIDTRRLRRVFRRITPSELEAIDTGLCLYLGPRHEDH